MSKILQRCFQSIDGYLFESCSVATCCLLRIGFGMLLLIYTVVWMLDGAMWFSDVGVISAETSRELLDGAHWSLFYVIPATPVAVRVCLAILLINSICLLCGIFSRFQAACIFFWLVSFQHRNPLIGDGEDTVFRLFAFMFVFLPLDDCWSVSQWWRARRAKRGSRGRSRADHERMLPQRAWALRLIQIEMCLIYLSAAWSKWNGQGWRDGTALFSVFQMEDLFGRGWLPAVLLESEPTIRWATWSVVLIEAVLPVALWLRITRLPALIVGIALHLSMEYAMHLFLFQWIMILGLMSFVHVHAPNGPAPREKEIV